MGHSVCFQHSDFRMSKSAFVFYVILSFSLAQKQGIETSENFPNNYPNSLDKNYTIEADDTFVIEFSSFDLEYHPSCSFDWVKIVDGDGSVLLPEKCGSEIPAPVTTNTNKAVVIFHSDGSETKQGFKLKWNTATIASVKSGTETSENFPDNYPNSLDKRYTIEADDTFVIEFSSFDLEYHPSCSFDWVKIVDGDGSVLLPEKCGSDIPAPVTTNTNKAVVFFHSDGSETKQGFKLKWNTVASVQSDCICGEAKREIHQEMQTNRIFGGRETEVNEYPWMARVISSYQDNNGRIRRGSCGGSLISDSWVVTAAHCARSEKFGDAVRVEVELGQHNRQTNALITTYAKAFIHEQYNMPLNDFALLKLDDPVDFDKNPLIRPICLPSSTDDDYAGSQAVLAGWGRTCETCEGSRVLLEANVTVLSRSQCQEKYDNTNIYIHESMICTSTNDGNPQGSCKGDSGGPLMTSRPGKNSYTLIGAVSWSAGGNCSSVDFPGGMAEVAHFLDWITEKTQGSKKCSRRIDG